MRSMVLMEPGRFEAVDIDGPGEPGCDEVRVRVHRIGVCGTDLHAFAGRQPFFEYPRRLGHELGVEVVAVGDAVTNVAVGDRCAVEPMLACGECHACGLGRSNCCENLKLLGVHVDGGMIEELIVPARCLHRSSKLSYDALSLIEPLSIGAHAVARSGLGAGQRVLVVGAGPIGLGTAAFALEAGGEVTVLERDADRCAVAGAMQGVRAVPELAMDERCEVVFDATGNQAAMQASFERVAFGGTLVFVGLIKNTITFDDVLFHRRELTLLASRNSLGQFPRLVGLVEAGRIDPLAWITSRLTLDAVPEAFAAIPRQTGQIKAVIEVV